MRMMVYGSVMIADRPISGIIIMVVIIIEASRICTKARIISLIKKAHPLKATQILQMGQLKKAPDLVVAPNLSEGKTNKKKGVYL